MKKRQPIKVGIAVVIALAAFQLGLPACHGQEPRAVLKGSGGHLYSLSISPDGKTLAAGFEDGSVELWEVSSAKVRARLRGHEEAVTAVAYCQDGRRLATASSDATICLWDLRTGRRSAVLRGHTDGVMEVAFGPGGTALASGDLYGKLLLWDVNAGRVRATPRGHDTTTASVQFSPDGKTLASAGYDNVVRFWDTATGKAKGALRGYRHPVQAAFSPEGETLAVQERDGNVRLYSARHLGQPRSFRWQPEPEGVTLALSLDFSPDGRLVGSCGVGVRRGRAADFVSLIWLGDVTTGKQIARLRRADGITRCLAFCSNGEQLAVGGWDGTVRLWDVAAVLKAGK
jgi:WD40 repeat protein